MLPSNQSMGGYAVADLGLSGTGLGRLLTEQVAGETEEQRRKRMLQLQQRQSSPAVMSLFGSGGLGAGLT